VSGPTDKARAMRALRTLYHLEGHERIVTVGLGDSLNDLPLLRQADIPIVVRNSAGRGGDALRHELPQARFTEAEGPAGWNEAVDQVIRATR
jgi:mannosyl-3-phosphoglycerate phosphatase